MDTCGPLAHPQCMSYCTCPGWQNLIWAIVLIQLIAMQATAPQHPPKHPHSCRWTKSVYSQSLSVSRYIPRHGFESQPVAVHRGTAACAECWACCGMTAEDSLAQQQDLDARLCQSASRVSRHDLPALKLVCSWVQNVRWKSCSRFLTIHFLHKLSLSSCCWSCFSDCV